MHRVRKFLCAASLAFALAGCSDQKDAAQSLVLQVSTAVSAAEPEAGKYIPDQLEDIQAKLTALQTSLGRKDYSAVVIAAPAVLATAQSLAAAAAVEKERKSTAQNAAWTTLAAVLPDQVTALQTRFNQLEARIGASRSATNVDLTAAGAAVAEITSRWSKAQAAFAGGNLREALTTAKDVKFKADALAVALKVKP